jgi:chorismate mutase
MNISAFGTSEMARTARVILGRCWSLALLVAVGGLAGCPANSTTAKRMGAVDPTAERAEASIDELLQLMRERLVLMHEVGRWKWNANRPIVDEKRERELLADMDERAPDYGLDRQTTRAFMAAQIEAGKLLQEADFERWKVQNQGQFEQVRDLSTDLRPAIDELNADMLEVLAELTTQFDREEVRAVVGGRAVEVLQGDGIDEHVRATAIGAFVKNGPGSRQAAPSR